MSNSDLARRTEIKLTFEGEDISADINKYLISLTYTDNEEEKTDDLQVSLDDRENIWLGDWLNQKSDGGEATVEKKKTASSFKVGDIVQFTGNTHYVSSNAASGKATKPGRAKITQTYNGKHPYHLRAVDNSNKFIYGVYGWVDSKFVVSLGGSTAPAGGTVSTGGVKVGDIVQFTGGSVYVSSTATKAAATRGASKCKVTIANSNTHPYHLISQDGKGVYGWVDSSCVKSSSTSNSGAMGSGGAKCAEISAIIIQKNWDGSGKDKILDCGIFEIDSVDGGGPPAKVDIKGTSIPYTSTIRVQKKTRAWENVKLSTIAKEIASKNGMKHMFESNYDPLYTRKEQIQESDIVFLQRLCKNAGISLKVTARTIVLFDASTYEQKSAVKTLKRSISDITSYRFSTNLNDTAYSRCHVSYTDPATKQTIEYTYTPRNSDKTGQTLEINEKVTNREEARLLAMKRLRQKNKSEFKADFSIPGDVLMVSGVTVNVVGYGAFDGKYIVEKATHTISAGYKTSITLRKVLEGY